MKKDITPPPETQPGPAGAAPLFFFSVGNSAIPSPYFYRLSALVDSVNYKAANGPRRIWTGTYAAPIPYEGEE